MVDAIKRRLGRWWWGRRQRASVPAVILCGCDTDYYAWLNRLQGRYEVVAMVTEEPWQHGTRVGGVRLVYPGEVRALCRRHEVSCLLYAHVADREAIEVACKEDSWHPLWCHGIEALPTVR